MLGKLLERILRGRIYSRLEVNGLIRDSQRVLLNVSNTKFNSVLKGVRSVIMTFPPSSLRLSFRYSFSEVIDYLTLSNLCLMTFLYGTCYMLTVFNNARNRLL